MAERPEDLNLPNAVITRIIKEAVSYLGRRGAGNGQEGRERNGSWEAALLILVLLAAPGWCQHLQGGPERHLPRSQRFCAVRHILVSLTEE